MAPSSRTVLVTGGAKGVGRGITESFLANGDRVLICGRGTPESLPSVGDHQAEFFAIDIRDNAAVDALCAQIAARYGQLDVPVNNAGGAPLAMADQAPPPFHEKIFPLNLLAPRPLAPHTHELMHPPQGGTN